MRFSIGFVFLSLLLCHAAFAQDSQTSSVPAEAPEPAAISFEQALQCTPPMRAQCGQQLAQNPEALADLDTWIQNAPDDDSQLLKINDLLKAMPPSFAGPRITALAKKSTQPEIQAQFAQWLKKYPDAYASVLTDWLKSASQNHSHFITLLDEYYIINNREAMAMWTRLVANNPTSELGQIASFGDDKPDCGDAVVHQIDGDADETKLLRLLYRFGHCKSSISADNPDVQLFSTATSALLANSTISRRIVAIRAIGALDPQSPITSQYAEQITTIYQNAKNSTERAFALQTLDKLAVSGQNLRLADALQNGDETLRLQAATLIATNHAQNFDLNVTGAAFDKEIWPDTQEMLYRAITSSDSMQSPNQFRKDILLDANKPQSLRIIALTDLNKDNPGTVTIDDMAALQQQDVSDDLIAAVAESVYVSHPSDRPVLRQWLEAQQPFERRYITTFVRFIKADGQNPDDSSSNFVRSICSNAVEQSAILLPCIRYLSDHADTDEDQALLQSLKSRVIQNDTITGFEF